MQTSLGKFLRKIRIDHSEILKNMADKLGVSASFLSAVENGKKKMPSSGNMKICELYNLDNHQKADFTRAIAESEDAIELALKEATFANRELAVSFARRFGELDNEKMEAIKKILDGSEKHDLS